MKRKLEKNFANEKSECGKLFWSELWAISVEHNKEEEAS